MTKTERPRRTTLVRDRPLAVPVPHVGSLPGMVASPPIPLPTSGNRPMSRLEKVGLSLFILVLFAFGVITEIRSAFQVTRRTDFGVYVRAAWAVTAGKDLYTVTDDHGWHYCYPPTFAILLVPLAEPYQFDTETRHLPFAVSVAIWYVLSVGCAVFAANALASGVVPGAVRWSRRWWYARLVPVYVCIGGVGFTLGRGQVNLLLIALVAGAFAATVRGRRMASGAWLAGAAALKMIPALLVLFPLVRRDWRALIGVALGGFVLLGVIPAAVWGIPKTIEMNRKPVEVVLLPAVASGGDQTRAIELHGAKSTDSQSVRAVVQAWIYPDRKTRPHEIDPIASQIHWLVSGLLVLITVIVGLRRLTPDPADQLIFLGCLCTVMMLLTPVSHMHYYAMVLPLVSGLWLRGVARRPNGVSADALTTVVLIVWGIATATPLFAGPTFDRLRECGFGTAFTIALWAFGLRTIGRESNPEASAKPELNAVRLAA